MPKFNQILLRWLPALIMMLVIFLISAQPSSHLPHFGWADYIVKKSGHAFGYAILVFLYWRGFNFHRNKRWIAWLMTIFYAFTDEFHQSFVSGRHPAILDVLIFDNVGSLVSLWAISIYRKQNDQMSHISSLRKSSTNDDQHK